jgi:TfoX/Sxy family transcriptional regulator of competence genes
MAYSDKLAFRVREVLSDQPVVEEKKMMGGLTFMVNNKMCVGILKEDLMARIDPDEYAKDLKTKGCRSMDFTGKPMKGFVFVDQEGTRSKKDLDYWIGLSLEYNKKARTSVKKKKR